MTRWEARQGGIGRAGIKSEQRTAKALGARLQPASGAMSAAKGDMKTDRFLIEAKSTTSASLGLKLDWLLKIGEEARRVGRSPCVAIDFIYPSGSSKERWLMVPEYVWKELVG